MKSSIPHALVAALTLASSFVTTPACNDGSAGYHDPGPRPLITKAGITGNVTTVNCAPDDTGGACPLSIDVYFRLPEEQFVTGAIVRFQHDGSDHGVDHYFPLKELKFGGGDSKDVAVSIDGAVPPTLIGTGTLFTFAVRLRTGLGEESDESTLTVTVTNIPVKKTGGTGTADGGT